jgi:GntR family transcriptional regulator, transcriptional repressor for pyruvate dehydrogenase complex
MAAERETGSMRPPPTMFGNVTREARLPDQVAGMMLEAILSRRLEPGARLPSERELGEQFGVSRTVIREAVRALTAKGLLEVRSGSGLRVAAVDAAAVSEALSLYLLGSTIDYSDVHEIRTALEVQMAAAAAERRTGEDIEPLVEAAERMESSADDVDVAARYDVEFHRAIGRATHNQLYVVLLDAVGTSLLQVRRQNLAIPRASRQTLSDHRRILDAIVAGDADAARQAMQDHLENVKSLWTSGGGDRAPEERSARRLSTGAG